MKKSMLILALLTVLLSDRAAANNIPPVAILSATPDRTWFYSAEEVVFDYYDSYDPDTYLTDTRWYINGVLQQSGTFTFSKCFTLYGSPEPGCYELANGVTTVQIKLGVKDLQGVWDYDTKTYTIQQHKGRKYFVKDHLGNVRTTVNRDGNVVGYDDYYPFGLSMSGRSNNTSNPNDMYKFTGHERDDEAGMTLDYMNARNYDPVIIRFLQIDPLAREFPGWNPYHYAYNNPLKFTDPTGMAPCPPDCDKTVNRTTSNGTQVSGSARYVMHEKTANGQRVAGAEYQGSVSGQYGAVNGRVSKFGAGYEGSVGPASVSGSVEIYGVEAEAGGRLGTVDNNIAIDAEGSALSAEASGELGLFTGEDGKYGASAGLEGGAYVLQGEANPSISVFGLKIGITYGGSVGSAHAGASAGATYNKETGVGTVKAKVHFGFGVGVKYGFEISTTGKDD